MSLATLPTPTSGGQLSAQSILKGLGPSQKKPKCNQLNVRKAIDSNDMKTLLTIFALKPDLLTETKQSSNALRHACLSGKKDIVQAILKIGLEQGQTVSQNNQKSTSKTKNTLSNKQKDQKFISDALVQCIRFQKVDMVKIFADKGFSLKTLIVQKGGEKLYPLDFAILGGHYESAHYIYETLGSNASMLKQIPVYEKISKKYGYRYVNFGMFLQGLKSGTQPSQMGSFLSKQLSPKEKLKYWRIHNEGCWAWFLRVVLKIPTKEPDFYSDNRKTQTLSNKAQSTTKIEKDPLNLIKEKDIEGITQPTERPLHSQIQNAHD